MRTDLDEQVGRLVERGPRRGGEEHRFADVAPPVRGVERCAGQPATGDGREERRRPGARADAVEQGPQRLLDRVHRGAVEGVVDVQHAEEDVPGGEPSAQVLQVPRVPGEGHVPRAVDRRHGQPAVVRGRLGPGLRLRQADRGHAALAGGGGLGPAAAGDDAGGGLLVQDAGRARGGDLAHAVPEDGRGPHPGPGEHGDQPHLRGVQQRLGDLRAAQLGGGDRGGQHVGDGPAQVRAEGRVVPVDRGPEDRVVRQQVGAHPGPLRAVAGEGERHSAPAGGVPRGRPGEAAPLGGRHQPVGRLLRPGGQDRHPVLVERTAQVRRAGDVVELLVRGGGQPVGHTAGGLGEGRAGVRGDDDGQRAVRGGLPPGEGQDGRGRPSDRGRCQHGVGVGTAEAEAVDAHHRTRPLCQPLAAHGRPQPPAAEVDAGVERFGVQSGRYGAVFQHQEGLEQARHARSRLRVAEVGLHRADGQRAGAAPGAEGPADGLALDGVAGRGAGAVGLEVDQVVRVDTGLRVQPLQQGLLRLAAGEGQAPGAAVAVDAGGQEHTADTVPVRQGVREPPEDDHGGRLGADEPVGRRRERPAAAGRREHRRRREARVAERVEQDVHPAGEGRRARPRPQVGAGTVDRGERGRTRGVHGDALAVPVEEVGDPVRRDGRGQSGHGVGVDGVRPGRLEFPEVPAGGTDEHPGVRTGPRVPAHSRVVQRLDGRLQEQPLLGVHPGRLAGGDAEVAGVEALDVVEESAGRRAALAGAFPPGVDEEAAVEAFGRNLRHQVTALAQRVPQFPGSADPAGEPAGHSHDGDGGGSRIVPVGDVLVHGHLPRRGGRLPSFGRFGGEGFPSGNAGKPGARPRAAGAPRQEGRTGKVARWAYMAGAPLACSSGRVIRAFRRAAFRYAASARRRRRAVRSGRRLPSPHFFAPSPRHEGRVVSADRRRPSSAGAAAAPGPPATRPPTPRTRRRVRPPGRRRAARPRPGGVSG